MELANKRALRHSKGATQDQIPNGFKQTEIGLIPKDWISLSIGEAVEENYIEKPIDGNHGNIHPKKSDFVISGIPFIMANNVINGNVNTSTCSFISKEQADNLQKGFSYEGDVLLTHKGTVGNVAIVPKTDTDYIMLTPQVTYYRTTEKLDNKYLKGYFESNYFQKMLLTLSGGGTRAYIGIVKQKELSLVIPPTLAEQKAIATALSDVDELISSLDALIAKKKAIKQGAMQQLLTPPHKGGKRLDGFDGEWVETILGDVCDIRKGQLITESTRTDGPIPVIAGGKKAAYYHANANRFGKTITISGSGASAGYVAFHNHPIFASDCSTIEESSKYSIEFIYYLLSLMQKQIYNAQTGGAQPHIHPSDLNPMEVGIPKVDEQKAIAQILSDMDKELEALATKKEKYEHIKQGMMQELLTGKKRLV